jgi:hypothetical protein
MLCLDSQIHRLKALIPHLVAIPKPPGPVPAFAPVIHDCAIGCRGFHLGAEPAAPGRSDKFIYLHT